MAARRSSAAAVASWSASARARRYVLSALYAVVNVLPWPAWNASATQARTQREGGEIGVPANRRASAARVPPVQLDRGALTEDRVGAGRGLGRGRGGERDGRRFGSLLSRGLVIPAAGAPVHVATATTTVLATSLDRANGGRPVASVIVPTAATRALRAATA